MNKGKKGSGFAGKAGEPCAVGDLIAISQIINKRDEVFHVRTFVMDCKGYSHNRTTALKLSKKKGKPNQQLFTDADVLGSIKAHLRACERCYYGDKK